MTCVRVCACMRVCVYVCMCDVYMCACVRVHMRMYAYNCVMCVCMFVRMESVTASHLAAVVVGRPGQLLEFGEVFGALCLEVVA